MYHVLLERCVVVNTERVVCVLMQVCTRAAHPVAAVRKCVATAVNMNVRQLDMQDWIQLSC